MRSKVEPLKALFAGALGKGRELEFAAHIFNRS